MSNAAKKIEPKKSVLKKAKPHLKAVPTVKEEKAKRAAQVKELKEKAEQEKTAKEKKAKAVKAAKPTDIIEDDELRADMERFSITGYMTKDSETGEPQATVDFGVYQIDLDATDVSTARAIMKGVYKAVRDAFDEEVAKATKAAQKAAKKA